jgi:hypothetical protein
MVSGSCALPPRWPPQCSCVVIESSFDPGERLQAPGSLWFLYFALSYLTSRSIWNYKKVNLNHLFLPEVNLVKMSVNELALVVQEFLSLPNNIWRLIVFAPFLIIIIIFFLLLHHPDCCLVMYCYSTFLFHYSYYYSSTQFCPLDFSEMPWSNFMKPCRNIICHVKLCWQVLIFSKWLSLPWKQPKC